MKNLTKEEILKFPNTCYGRMVGKQLSNQVVGELLQYKQLEEEIGIDLITLFKALKNGIYDENKTFYEMGCFNLKCDWLLKTPNNKYLIFDVENSFIEFKIADYKKTWWLKANRSE